jgi:hypothetical protein
MNLFNIFKPKPIWPTSAAGAHALGVACGLTRVNPDFYYGWRGDCPGCDVDAGRVNQAFINRQYPTQFFLNAGVRKRPVFDTLLRAYDILQGEDDVLFHYFSGHGGQEPDRDGDEIDGQDETQCFFDGPVMDDDYRRLWLRAPPKLRIVFISDSCNSGTMSRAQRRLRLGLQPLRFPRRLRNRSLKRTIPEGFQGRLLHIAGCPDGMSSYGSPTGGAFTQRLFTDAIVANTRPGLTYVDWINEAIAAMPRNQVPLTESFGDSFTNRVALT